MEKSNLLNRVKKSFIIIIQFHFHMLMWSYCWNLRVIMKSNERNTLYLLSSWGGDTPRHMCVSPYFERALSSYFRNSLQVFLKYSARKNCVLKFKFLKSKRKISPNYSFFLNSIFCMNFLQTVIQTGFSFIKIITFIHNIHCLRSFS